MKTVENLVLKYLVFKHNKLSWIVSSAIQKILKKTPTLFKMTFYLLTNYPIVSEIYPHKKDPPCPWDLQWSQKCFRPYEENHRTEAVPIWSDISEI